MAIRIISKSNQAYGAFNGGQIIENKPIGFPQDGGFVRPFSNLFYWARAEAVIESTIGLHPHQGFEIMSFVLKGTIRHYDTKMDAWKDLETGSAQIIRAGNGIKHAEHMMKGSVMFQIWVDPNLDKTLNQEASYNDYTPEELGSEKIDGNEVIRFIGEHGAISLDAPGLVFERWKIENGKTFTNPESMFLSLYVIGGSGQINGESIEQDDFIIIDEPGETQIKGKDLDIFLISSKKDLSYKTYAGRMASKEGL